MITIYCSYWVVEIIGVVWLNAFKHWYSRKILAYGNTPLRLNVGTLSYQPHRNNEGLYQMAPHVGDMSQRLIGDNENGNKNTREKMQRL